MALKAYGMVSKEFSDITKESLLEIHKSKVKAWMWKMEIVAYPFYEVGLSHMYFIKLDLGLIFTCSKHMEGSDLTNKKLQFFS